MSYILDALKKADHARQDSGTPVPEPMIETPSMAKNLNWQKIAIVFVGVNLVLAASLAIYRGLHPVADETPVMTTAAQTDKAHQSMASAPSRPEPGAPATSPPSVKPEPAPPADNAAIPDEQAMIDEMAAMDAMVADLTGNQSATPLLPDQAGNTPVSPDMHALPTAQGNSNPAKPPSPARNKPAVEPLIQQVEVRDQTAIAAVPPIEPPTLPPMRSSPAVERALPEEPPVSNNQESYPFLMDVPLLKEKPFGFRQTVPALVIDIHVYSDDPAKRFAMINMKRRREGDDMGNNLKLISITQKGVVMSYQGEMFQVNVQ